MKNYDVIVLGAGDVGLGIAFRAASEKLSVALIDRGNVGGTCINTGCVPSKTLIHAADVVRSIGKAREIGIRAEITGIEFDKIMARMRKAVRDGRVGITKSLSETDGIDLIRSEARFVDDWTVETEQGKVSGKKIFIATGARPKIPPIEGLKSVPYLTNESILEISALPESLLIAGGGYVGLEYAHFFSAMGSRVSVVDRNTSLLHHEDHEISAAFSKELRKHADLHLGYAIQKASGGAGRCSLHVRKERGRRLELTASRLLIATGRESNADALRPENAGIETDENGFIHVDEYLMTNNKHIWAVGDANGKAMFTHAGDREAEIAWNNATQRTKIKMDYSAVPHAVFTHPQIASVGFSERGAAAGHEVITKKAFYSDTVMGEAMAEEQGFAKAVIEKDTGKLLGFHIIGPHAAILIQEVVNAMGAKSGINSITGSMHIFPALSNLITETMGSAPR